MIDRVSRQTPASFAGRPNARAAQLGGFGDVLKQEMAKQAAQPQPQPQAQMQTQPGIAFSKHAISRVEERGIEVTPELLDQLAGSVSRAQEKGATNILAMDATKAFIINVPAAKVITAISQSEMQENIFTNIDGAVFL